MEVVVEKSRFVTLKGIDDLIIGNDGSIVKATDGGKVCTSPAKFSSVVPFLLIAVLKNSLGEQ